MSNESPKGAITIPGRVIRGLVLMIVGIMTWNLKLPTETNLGAGGAVLLLVIVGLPILGLHMVISGMVATIPKKGDGGARDIMIADLASLPALVIRKIFGR